MQFECKECGKEFSSQRSLHTHIKAHDMFMGEYYVKHHSRKDKLTGKPIEFKNVKQYFSSNFNRPANMLKWCDTAPKNEAKEFVLEELKKRLEEKELSLAPSSLYLKTAKLPTLDIIKDLFGSYGLLCKELGVEPAYKEKLCDEFFEDYNDADICIDTRENKPLKFSKSQSMKLDFGDYTLTPNTYTFTHVERKSFNDFATTVTNGHDRFLRELDRCKSVGCYMFIVVETNFSKLGKTNNFAYKRFNLDYVFNKMRSIEAQYADCCQFVFSGSRKDSQELIPKILCLGKKLWRVDLQYFWNKILEKNELDRGEPEALQEVSEHKPRNTFKRRLYRRRRG